MTGRRLALALLAYLVLLGLSHAWRASSTAARAASPGEHAVEVLAHGDGTGAVRIAYRDARKSGTTEVLPVLLLHGNPGSKEHMEGASVLLAVGRRTIAPDLPGFGGSSRDVDDLGLEAQATRVIAFLDALQVERVHVVGYSLGAGVALHVAHRAPRRVRSLSLLSAIGVQELALLGNHHVNRVLHGAQLGMLWMLHETVPHFGLLDGVPLSVAYARAFHDADLRPLRGLVRAWNGPLLVLHGKDDLLVPVAAARELSRLAPQAELEVWPGGHFLVLERPMDVGARLATFVDAVDAGRAAVRLDASPEALARSLEPYDAAGQPPLGGLPLLVALLLLALATVFSEDLTCLVAGALVAQGRLPLLHASAACFAGIYVVDMAIFLAGRRLGPGVIARAPLRWWLGPERVARGADLFRARGFAVLLLTRLLPAARLPTYFAVGAVGAPPARFALLFAVTVAVWTPCLVALSAWLGGTLQGHVEVFQRHVLLVLLLMLAAFLVARSVLRAFLVQRRVA